MKIQYRYWHLLLIVILLSIVGAAAYKWYQARRQAARYPHFTHLELTSPWTVGNPTFHFDGGSFSYPITVPAASSEYIIEFSYGDWDKKQHWQQVFKWGGPALLTTHEVEFVFRKLREAKGAVMIQHYFQYRHGRMPDSGEEIRQFIDQLPPEWSPTIDELKKLKLKKP